jgi:hypothetical protein
VHGLALAVRRASPAAAAGFLLGALTAALSVALALSMSAAPGGAGSAAGGTDALLDGGAAAAGAMHLRLRAAPAVAALRAAHAALAMQPEEAEALAAAAAGLSGASSAAASALHSPPLGGDAPLAHDASDEAEQAAACGSGALSGACRLARAARAALSRPAPSPLPPATATLSPPPAPAAHVNLWAWRAASRPTRTLLLISALHTPRCAALWALTHADAPLLAFMLPGLPADAPPTRVAAATLRCAFAALAAPHAWLGGAAWRSRGTAPFAAHWASALCAAHAALTAAAAAGTLAGGATPRAQMRAGVRALRAAAAPTAARAAAVVALSHILPQLPPAASDAALLLGAGLLPAAALAARLAPWLRIADAAAAAAAAAASAAASAATGADDGGATPRRAALFAVRWESLAAAAAAAAAVHGGGGSGSGATRHPTGPIAAAAAAAAAAPVASRFPPPLLLPPSADDCRSLPDYLRCPVTLCAMREPAVTPSGITYERNALIRWVREHGTEPTTRRPMSTAHIVPNLAARAALEAWARAEAARGSVMVDAAGGAAATVTFSPSPPRRVRRIARRPSREAYTAPGVVPHASFGGGRDAAMESATTLCAPASPMPSYATRAHAADAGGLSRMSLPPLSFACGAAPLSPRSAARAAAAARALSLPPMLPPPPLAQQQPWVFRAGERDSPDATSASAAAGAWGWSLPPVHDAAAAARRNSSSSSSSGSSAYGGGGASPRVLARTAASDAEGDDDDAQQPGSARAAPLSAATLRRRRRSSADMIRQDLA